MKQNGAPRRAVFFILLALGYSHERRDAYAVRALSLEKQPKAQPASSTKKGPAFAGPFQ